jgi:hypothetical protein
MDMSMVRVFPIVKSIHIVVISLAESTRCSGVIELHQAELNQPKCEVVCLSQISEGDIEKSLIAMCWCDKKECE